MEIIRSGINLCAETNEKPCIKRFSGKEKCHRNSIKITVALWSECNYGISDDQVRPYQIEARRSGFDLVWRSSGVSAL